MASKENSMVNEGQLWSVWTDCLGLKNTDNDDDDVAESEKKMLESDAMKLRKDDMSLFGFCPAWDDFYLVVCELCGQVVKPQGLKNHIDLRHGNSSLARSERPEAAMQHSKSTVGKGASSFSSHSIPNKSVGSHGVKSSSPRHHSKTGSHTHGSHPSSLQSASSHSSSNLVSSVTKPEKSKPPPKPKRNNSMAPVVRMERIPPSLMKSAATPVANTVPSDKKELPSPQQPPPIMPITASSSTSGPGPGKALLLNSSPCNPSSPSCGPSTAGIASSLSIGKSEGPHQGVKKTTTSSKSKKVPKERKLLLCKDREYDPNKHCGVKVADTGKPCTRSLTCKTHSLSFRRAVVGRRKNFDELLADHRAAKEASVKATKAQAALVKRSPLVSHSNDHNTSENQSPLSERSDISGTSVPLTSTKANIGPNKLNASSSSGHFRSSGATSVSSQASHKAATAQGIPSNRISGAQCSDVSNSETVAVDDERHQETDKIPKGSMPDPCHITHHPKPVAVCTFGLRQLGNGMFMIDRRWDVPRAALRTAICMERSSHPPPLKRLCVESRLPPVPEPVDPSDPYSFTCSEPSVVCSSTSQANQVSQTTMIKGAITTPMDMLHPHSVTATTVSKVKPSSSQTTFVTSHKPAQPKIATSKVKEKNINANRVSGNTSSNPSKKKRTSANVPNGTSGVSKSSVLPSLSTTTGTVTLSAVSSSQALPLSFPLAIGEHLGALSRLQVAGRNSLTLSPAIIRNAGITTLSGAASPSAKDGSVMVTGLDMLNGQIPVSSSLLHSVTVSRPLLATSPGGLGITLGAAGLMGQLSQLPKTSVLDGELSSSNSTTSGSNKNSHALSSMLNNSHILTNAVSNSSGSTWSSAKAKSKVRKATKTGAVNSTSHSPGVCESSVNILQGTMLGNSSNCTNTNNHSSPHTLSSPSTTPSPHLRSDSTSPQVPATSPLHNGLGPSPPPFFAPKGNSISGAIGGSQPLSISPASRTSTPSPGTDMSSPGSTGSGPKGKNSSRLPSSLPKQPAITTGHSTFHVSMPPPLNFSAVSIGGTTLSGNGNGTSSGKPVSYQQVFASQMLSNAQLNQLKLQPGSKQRSKTSASAPPSLTLATATLPLKLPLLTASGITSSSTQQQHPLLLKGDDSRRTAVPMQGSSSLPT